MNLTNVLIDMIMVRLKPTSIPNIIFIGFDRNINCYMENCYYLNTYKSLFSLKDLDQRMVNILIVNNRLFKVKTVNDLITRFLQKVDRNRRAVLVEWSNNITIQESIIKALTGFNNEMNDLAKKIKYLLNNSSEIQIKSSSGTDLKLLINQSRSIYIEDSFSDLCDNIVQIPGGEVFIAPIENFTHGKIVAPLKIFGIQSAESICLTLREGRIVEIEGKDSNFPNESLLQIIKINEVLCEFGIGINKEINFHNFEPWVEKSLGTIHLGFGDNTHFGGTNKSNVHYDITINNVELFLNKCFVYVGEGGIEYE